MARRISFVLIALALVPAAWWSLAKTGDHDRPRAAPSPPPPRSAYADGACVSFEPASGPARAVVFLDAGHGGRDPGAIAETSRGRRVDEKTATLEIVKTAALSFRALGYRVVASRWSDTSVAPLRAGDVDGRLLTPLGLRRDLLARVACANEAKADVLVSVHLNAFSDPGVGGASTIYNAKRSFTSANRRLAEIVQRHVLGEVRRAGWRVADRRVMDDAASPGGALTEEGARYGHSIIIGPYAKDWVPEPSAMPGVIMEPLFLTRPVEADIATSPKGRVALATAMTNAVEEFLSGR